MNFKRIISLLSAVIIVLSSFAACSKKDDDKSGNESQLTTKISSVTFPSTTINSDATANIKYTVKTNDGSPLNLRKGPGTEYDVITTIPNGHTVMILDNQGAWAKVNYGNFEGWVNMDYVEEQTTVPSVVNPVVPTTNANNNTQSGETEQGGYLYSYAGFNPQVISIDPNNWELTLLNRHYTLPDGYTPQLAEAVKGSGVYLDYRVAPHYQKMYDAALKDGVTLTPNSGYRSYSTQKTNFENKIKYYQSQGYDKVTATQNASRVILLPGTSEHNAGFAMDIGWVTEDFENSPAYAWLDAHAHEYGFILRYPEAEDKQAKTEIIYEPWHWRYVGVETATKLKASGQVLEEYLGVR